MQNVTIDSSKCMTHDCISNFFLYHQIVESKNAWISMHMLAHFRVTCMIDG